jgi:RimJ/RimL family protein N-acetyltransferase
MQTTCTTSQNSEAITTQRLVLSPVAAPQAGALYDLISTSAAAQWGHHLTLPFTRADAERVARASEAGLRDSGTHVFLARTCGDTPQTVGAIALYAGNTKATIADIDYWVAASHHGAGYAGEMLAGIVTYAFEARSILRLRMAIHPDNIAAQYVLNRHGFARVGVRANQRPVFALDNARLIAGA